MNLSLIDHLNRLNPTGVKWENMTEEQRLELRNRWHSVVSNPDNLGCECPSGHCKQNSNCKFCMPIHRFYGSLPYCLQRIDDEISAGVPNDVRHNIHSEMNKSQVTATSRDEYKQKAAAWHREHPEQSPELRKKKWEEWDAIIQDPDNLVCSCTKTDCLYHGNCHKCIALHRHYDGFPYCCRDIGEKIEVAVQSYWDKIADTIWDTKAEVLGEKP